MAKSWRAKLRKKQERVAQRSGVISDLQASAPAEYRRELARKLDETMAAAAYARAQAWALAPAGTRYGVTR